MEKYVRYKRFSETHDETSIQNLYNKLITEGWEIIYYNEVRHPSGPLSGVPKEASIHVVIVAGKRQENELKSVL